MTLRSIVLMAGSIGLLAGCSNYYQVRDPQSGNVYYTRLINDRVGGAVSFEDKLTGRDVTLQTSEIAKIDGDLYKARTVHNDMNDRTARPSGSRISVSPDNDIHVKPGQDVHIDVDKSTDTPIRIDP